MLYILVNLSCDSPEHPPSHAAVSCPYRDPVPGEQSAAARRAPAWTVEVARPESVPAQRSSPSATRHQDRFNKIKDDHFNN